MEQDKILEAIQQLSLHVKNLHKPEPSRSTDLKELFAALAKAQSEMEVAGRKSENPYFKTKYADLSEIVRASRACLSRNGLSVIQQILPNNDGQSILHTILAHSSGEWISSQMRIIPPKSDVQTLGSYITFLKRYSYAALIGVVSSEEDDDGEVAVATDRELFAKGPAETYKPKNEPYDTVSRDQLDELQYELVNYPDIAEEVLTKMKIQSLADLPKSKFRISIERIREIKNLRNSGK
jgi:hypothetical protein